MGRGKGTKREREWTERVSGGGKEGFRNLLWMQVSCIECLGLLSSGIRLPGVAAWDSGPCMHGSSALPHVSNFLYVI